MPRPPNSRRSILISSSHLHLGLPSVLLSSDPPHQNPVCTSLLSYTLHAPPIPSFLIWSPEWYLVWNTEHKAHRYVVFSTPLLPRPLHFNTRLRISDLGKTRFPPYHSESNCCVGQGEFVWGVKVMRKWSRIRETILNSLTGRSKMGQVIFSAKLRGEEITKSN